MQNIRLPTHWSDSILELILLTLEIRILMPAMFPNVSLRPIQRGGSNFKSLKSCYFKLTLRTIIPCNLYFFNIEMPNVLSWVVKWINESWQWMNEWIILPKLFWGFIWNLLWKLTMFLLCFSSLGSCAFNWAFHLKKFD